MWSFLRFVQRIFIIITITIVLLLLSLRLLFLLLLLLLLSPAALTHGFLQSGYEQQSGAHSMPIPGCTISNLLALGANQGSKSQFSGSVEQPSKLSLKKSGAFFWASSGMEALRCGTLLQIVLWARKVSGTACQVKGW